MFLHAQDIPAAEKPIREDLVSHALAEPGRGFKGGVVHRELPGGGLFVIEAAGAAIAFLYAVIAPALRAIPNKMIPDQAGGLCREDEFHRLPGALAPYQALLAIEPEAQGEPPRSLYFCQDAHLLPGLHGPKGCAVAQPPGIVINIVFVHGFYFSTKPPGNNGFCNIVTISPSACPTRAVLRRWRPYAGGGPTRAAYSGHSLWDNC